MDRAHVDGELVRGALVGLPVGNKAPAARGPAWWSESRLGIGSRRASPRRRCHARRPRRWPTLTASWVRWPQRQGLIASMTSTGVPRGGDDPSSDRPSGRQDRYSRWPGGRVEQFAEQLPHRRPGFTIWNGSEGDRDQVGPHAEVHGCPQWWGVRAVQSDRRRRSWVAQLKACSERCSFKADAEEGCAGHDVCTYGLAWPWLHYQSVSGPRHDRQG